MASKFWTDEMIARAVPKIKRKKAGAHAREVVTTATETVPDADRIKPPYQSVGVLFFTLDGDPLHGTAYATNALSGAKNVIFTAAHNLVDKTEGDSKNIYFVPGYQTDGSTPFGEFDQIDGGKGTAFFVHPKYDLNKRPEAYDLGAVKLRTNEDDKELGDVVGLLNTVVDKSYTTSDSFTAIGYPDKNVMEKNTGNYKFKLDNEETVVKNEGLSDGSSGGPWLFKGDANGNQSSSTDTLKESLSPYYSKEKIDAVVNQL